MSLRLDLQIISDWIPSAAKVLDLGCGNGHLLKHLQQRGIQGYGVEIDNQRFAECIDAGINVIQADLNQGLKHFADQSFDVVVLSQTLQAVQRPDNLLDEIMRVGRQGIIGFPNFAHWRCRWQLCTRGRMPVSSSLPNLWYDTPNIHLCTLRDFEDLCAQKQLRVLSRSLLNPQRRAGLATRLAPNWFAELALYQLERV